MEDNQEPKLQPALDPEREKNPTGPSQVNSAVVWIVTVGLGLLLAAGFLSSQKTDNIAAVTSGSRDNVSADMRAQIDSQFMQYTGKLQLLDITDKNAKEEFLAATYMTQVEKEKVLSAVADGEKKIGIVSLWDNFDEDGDVVRIQTSEASFNVPIFHTPARFFIPFKPGEPLLIIGVHDGGGGITAAIETQSGSVPLPVMFIGQTISLPLL